MHLWIDRNQPISIKEQIKRQIRALITSGRLDGGRVLPSAKDLAAMVDVNRNTTALAYRELAAEGLLTTVRGSGTYVRQGLVAVDPDPLQSVVDSAFERAATLGYTRQQLVEAMYLRLAERDANRPTRILVAWCNELSLSQVSRSLEDELGVETKGVLIQELEADPDLAAGYLNWAEMIVTSINHLEIIDALAQPAGLPVVGLMLTSMTRIFNEIARLESGTTVGSTCVNERASEATCRTVELSGGKNLKTIWAGADDTDRLREMLDSCQVIFASSYVYDRVRRMAGPDKTVINLEVAVDGSHIELVREQMEAIGAASKSVTEESRL